MNGSVTSSAARILLGQAWEGCAGWREHQSESAEVGVSRKQLADNKETSLEGERSWALHSLPVPGFGLASSLGCANCKEHLWASRMQHKEGGESSI